MSQMKSYSIGWIRSIKLMMRVICFYPNGPMRAAHGTFLSSLLLIKAHEMVADQAAVEFNVLWSRTTPIMVSVVDDAYETVLTLQCDHGMGMTVTGDPGSVWAFRFACSSAISPLEEQVLSSIIQGSIGLSVTSFLGQLILNGGSPEVFMSNGYVVFKVKGIDDFVLMLDPATGVVRDVMTSSIYGVYCFHDQLTTNTIQLAGKLNSTDPNTRPEWFDQINVVSVSLGTIVASMGIVEFGEVAFAGAKFVGPVALVLAPLAFLNAIQPGAIEEAERDGNFNTAEYLKNNNLLDLEWDVMLQCLGKGGPPQGVWDESDQYAQYAIQNNQEEMKEYSQTLYNGALELFLPDDHTLTIDETEEALMKSGYLLMIIDESGDTELYDDLSCPYDRYKYEKARLEAEEEYDTALSQPPTDPLGQFLVKFIEWSVKKSKSGKIGRAHV